MDEYYEAVVCQDDEIKEGQMKEVQLADKVGCLLVRQNGELSALSNKCTHFGAPLIKGSLGEGVVRCPWHGACFNVKSGDIEDFPGLDSLQKYDVDVDKDGQVRVKAKKSATTGYRTKPSAATSNAGKCVVIVGGGPSAQACAETLRTRCPNPWDGRIVMLTEEATGPYDRTKLSKALATKAEEMLLRQPDFYQRAGIELKTGSKVVSLNTTENRVETENGEVHPYDYCVLATGSSPRTLPLQGASGAKNLMVLRTPEDANRIAAQSEQKNVVIIGSSFIGMEVAAFLSKQAASVTVVGNTKAPFSNVLGEEVGQWMRQLHESKGVKFQMETCPKELLTDPDTGNVTKVVLDNGQELEADLCVVGIGVVPNTAFAKGSGLKMDSRGFVEVDGNLRSSVANVFAAGDIAKFPLDLPNLANSPAPPQAAIGHWQLALSHGKTSGMNVASETTTPVRTVPFFWSMQYGKSVRYAGHAPHGFDEIAYDGTVAEGKFAAYYLKDGVVMAVATLMMDPLAADFANLLMDGRKLTKEDLADQSWRDKYSVKATA